MILIKEYFVIGIKRSIVLFVFFLWGYTLQSQTDPYAPEVQNIIPHTPQAAAFARYGEYPISPATGVPEISIPLYEIVINDIVIPISISYHASGIKVEDVATPVGLGWALNAGGVITRSIRGAKDFMGYSNNTIKSVDHINMLISTPAYQYATRWMELAANANAAHDIQSDRYAYNFNGKSGVFVFNSSNNQLTTIPYSPIIIEPTANGFKVTDTDGLIYYFEASENSGEAYLHSFGATAWYVTKIESQMTGESVNYKYRQGTTYTDYVSGQSVGSGKEYYFQLIQNGPATTLDVDYSRVVADRKTHNKILTHRPLLLEEVTWRNNKIKIDYATDRLDKYKDRITQIKIMDNSKTFRSISFDNNFYWGNNERNYRMKLKGITIKGGQPSHSIEDYGFVYNENIVLPAYPSTQPTPNNRGYSIDYWGYYNGTYSINLVPNNYLSNSVVTTDRNPHETYMKACILTGIRYPTGGTTRFEYESNRIANGYDYRPAESVFGGLRVKSIISDTGGGEIKKNYEYEGKAVEQISVDMFKYTKRKIFSYVFGGLGLQKAYDDWTIYSSEPIYSLTGWSTSPVFYNKVTEYWGTSTINNGKKVSYFRENLNNALKHSYGSNVRDTDIPHLWNAFTNIDQGLMKPLLQKEEIFERRDTGYVLKKKIENFYTNIQKGSIVTGVRLGFRDEWIHDPSGGTVDVYSPAPYASWNQYFTENLAYYDVEAYQDFNLLGRTTTTDYTDIGSIATSVFYTYDRDYRILSPISQYMEKSDGTVLTDNMNFPFNETGIPYPEMVSKNILEPVIRRERANGKGEFITLQQEFRKEGTRFLVDNVKTGKNGVLKVEQKYHSYDIYSNPTFVSKDDMEKIVYLWGYNGQYPVAKIENATYTEVASVLGTTFINSLNSGNVTDAEIRQKMDILRSHTSMRKAQVTSYTYQPLVGMTSQTDPRGITEYYEYDNLGRLSVVKDFEGNIQKTYCYNYAGQQIDCF